MFVLIAKMSLVRICLWKVRKKENEVHVNRDPQCCSSYCHNQKCSEKPIRTDGPFQLEEFSELSGFFQIHRKTSSFSLFLVKSMAKPDTFAYYSHEQVDILKTSFVVGFVVGHRKLSVFYAVL